MKKLLSYTLGLILLLPISGELWRLSVFGLELLPSDILIPIFIVLWGLEKLKNDRVIRLGKVNYTILIFLWVMLLSYAINLFRFPFIEMAVAATYLIRFGMYVVLAPIAYDLLKRDESKETQNIIIGSTVISMVLISIFGFLQLKYFPSFLELGLYLQGWDPHIGRLLSTWFDPNFIGGFLSFVLGIVMALGLYFRHEKNEKWFRLFAAISILGLMALYYTFSRSGYLAMVGTLGVLALLKSRKLLIAVTILMIVGLSISPRAQERVGEALDSGKALIGAQSQHALDPTARLRVWSWQFAGEIIQDHPWVGVGYSRYAYEINKRGHGLPSDHSAGGSDSSLLTLWATTGIFGLLSYLAIGFVAAMVALKNAWKKSDFKSYLSAGLLASFGGLMIHSLFVNSLLFPLMMVYMWPALALLDEERGTK